MAGRNLANAARAHLRKKALSYPGAFEDFPWGEPLYKVRGRIFLFLEVDAEGLSVTAKLVDTAGIALMLPNVEPTSHNLGRSGWVTASFAPDEPAPLSMLEAWIDESYRAVAPRRLVASLDAAPARRRPRRRSPSRG
jgi:predicted DNA-binding protein (MmcQ/YjbR family)